MSTLELPTRTREHKSPVPADLSPQVLYDKCLALASNLWWSWHPEVINLFRDLDPNRWRQLDHNPIALLREFSPQRLAARADEMVLYSRINHAYRRLKEYVYSAHNHGARRTRECPGGQPRRVFFGRVRHARVDANLLGGARESCLVITSKAPAIWVYPFIGIGLFYDQGYFKQHLDAHGYQNEEYLDTKVENLPLELRRGPLTAW